VLTTASGIGAILGAAALGKAGQTGGLKTLARRGAVCLGVIVVILGAVPNFWLAVAAIGLVGIAIVVCSVGLQVLLQNTIDESFRGRVLGLWGMCAIAGPGVGGAMLGSVAQTYGLRPATIASGVACTALSAWIAYRSPGLFKERPQPA
jgi:MFS transporter, DHA3 family, macrolide efflux protein